MWIQDLEEASLKMEDVKPQVHDLEGRESRH